MYETFNKAKGKSYEFWTGVKDGTGLPSTNDARLKLRNNLMGLVVPGVTGPARGISAADVYAWCINAWNMFRDDVPCKQLKGETAGKRPKAK